MRKVLVTGGAGYKGCVLVPKLLEAGYRVVVYDLMLFGSEGLAAHPNLQLVTGILDFENLVAGDRALDFKPVHFHSDAPARDLAALRRGYGDDPGLFDDRFERMIAWEARRRPDATRAELEASTLAYMATMPAWRDHPRVAMARRAD